MLSKISEVVEDDIDKVEYKSECEGEESMLDGEVNYIERGLIRLSTGELVQNGKGSKEEEKKREPELEEVDYDFGVFGDATGTGHKFDSLIGRRDEDIDK